jgi:hypothetical protein
VEADWSSIKAVAEGLLRKRTLKAAAVKEMSCAAMGRWIRVNLRAEDRKSGIEWAGYRQSESGQ